MEKYKKEELEKFILIENKSYTSIGNVYGVSGTAIKKAAKRFGIKVPKRRTINENENFSHPRRKSISFVNKISDDEFINIIETSLTWKNIGKKLGYASKVLSSNVKDSITERCLLLNIKTSFVKKCNILDKTKGDLFKERKNWQSARSGIVKSANLIFNYFNPEPKCVKCGYSIHVDVAHVKSVSSFDNSVTIREINSIDNLIGLCPNHHWEYDNGFLKLD